MQTATFTCTFSWAAPLMVKSIESGRIPVLMLQQKHDGPIFNNYSSSPNGL